MPKVVSLKVVKKSRLKPNPADLRLLKKVSDAVRDGTIEELAIVGLNRDGTMQRGWSSPRKNANAFRMLGSIDKMRDEYLHIEIEA